METNMSSLQGRHCFTSSELGHKNLGHSWLELADIWHSLLCYVVVQRCCIQWGSGSTSIDTKRSSWKPSQLCCCCSSDTSNSTMSTRSVGQSF